MHAHCTFPYDFARRHASEHNGSFTGNIGTNTFQTNVYLSATRMVAALAAQSAQSAPSAADKASEASQQAHVAAPIPLHGVLGSATENNGQGFIPGLERAQRRATAGTAHTTVVCETGLNCGHSAALFLMSHPSVVYHGWDLGDYTASRLNAAALQAAFPGRVHIHFGNSRTTIGPVFRGHHNNRTLRVGGDLFCDIVSIDGEHTRAGAASDLKQLVPHLHPQHGVLLVDDCAQHVPGILPSYEEYIKTSTTSTSTSFYIEDALRVTNVRLQDYRTSQGFCLGFAASNSKGGGSSDKVREVQKKWRAAFETLARLTQQSRAARAKTAFTQTDETKQAANRAVRTALLESLAHNQSPSTPATVGKRAAKYKTVAHLDAVQWPDLNGGKRFQVSPDPGSRQVSNVSLTDSPQSPVVGSAVTLTITTTMIGVCLFGILVRQGVPVAVVALHMLAALFASLLATMVYSVYMNLFNVN